ncbi:MAG: sodium pump decarboxylase subunit gamma [Treponema sp.]|nr:sodium pump decarboxylase subunit gamma [Treponema sp.]
MTLIEMINQGSILHLIGMGIIFTLMIALLTKLGRGIEAKFNIQKEGSAFAGEKSNDGVIAAITAAVTEYRKTNN